jgi:predicted nucleotidyltransferase
VRGVQAGLVPHRPAVHLLPAPAAAEPSAIDPRAFAESIAEAVAAVVGADLVGVYLHGSAAAGGFNPARSDVDLIVVTQRPMDEAERRSLARLLLDRSRRPYPVEMSVVSEASLRAWTHPLPFEFHFSEGWRDRMEAALAHRPFELSYSPTNADLAAELAALRQRGLRLRGAPIADVFPDVPARDVLDSISQDLRWAAGNERYVYGVLNACRALAYLADGSFLSKAEAARWALGILAPANRDLVARALAVYDGRAASLGDEADVRAFVDHVRRRVEAAV